MNIHSIFYCLALGLLVSCNTYKAQIQELNSQFVGKYASVLKSNETEVFSRYHYVYTLDDNGIYTQKTFFPETKQITSLVTYESQDSYLWEGPYATWYDNGNKRVDGQYLDNQKEGLWSYYNFATGKINSQGQYKNNKETAVWKYYDDDRLAQEFTYKEGMKEGEFAFYDTLGNIANKGIYRADTIFQESNPQYSQSKVVIEMPFINKCKANTDKEERSDCSNQAILKHIYQNITYPIIARENGLEGTALITFTVLKDGTMDNIKVISGLCQSISDECLRVVKTMPRWESGRREGKKVDVQFNLPIKFKLE